MAEMVGSVSTTVEPGQPADNVMIFGGERRNMAMGVAMLGAGSAAFVSGLTHSFFAQAIAWTFIFWGLLFLYGDLLLSTRRFEARDDTLTVSIPMRLWNRKRIWAWQDIHRLDVIIQGRDIRQDGVKIYVHHQFPGEVSLDREDRNYDPELVHLIVERAKLRPDAASKGIDFDDLPLGQNATYTWKK